MFVVCCFDCDLPVVVVIILCVVCVCVSVIVVCCIVVAPCVRVMLYCVSSAGVDVCVASLICIGFHGCVLCVF